MIANQPKPTPRLPLTINFKIPAYWTPEQALAVFELLDHLRDQIAAHYSVQLFELSRQQHLPASTGQSASKTRGEPTRTQTHFAREVATLSRFGL
jgi:hypothetical protein